MFIAALLLAVRLFNPADRPVDARLVCGSETRSLHVEARDVADLADCASPLTDGQLVAVNSESCAIDAPEFGCKNGTATVAVPYVEGASYAWIVDGATIAGGDGTNRLVLNLGAGPTAHVKIGDCEAVIALRDPIVIDHLSVPPRADANKPVTVEWAYAPGSEPRSQVLAGDDFEEPVVLDPAARSYTWTPETGGTKQIELRASHAVAIPTHETRRRRSVASKQNGVASECATSSMKAELNVDGCALKPRAMTVPGSVEAGEKFKASIELLPGETSGWRVYGGTLLSENGLAEVEVQAPFFDASMRIEVDVKNGPDCRATTKRTLSVKPHAACGTTPKPTASLSIESLGCNKAVVRATFTGTPPFSGTWNGRGSAFTTDKYTITHEYANAEVYTIEDFHDATCPGIVTQTARADVLHPSAVLSMPAGHCNYDTVRATLRGTPPFDVHWSDGRRDRTSETTVDRPAAGNKELSIHSIDDALCYAYSEFAREPITTIEPAHAVFPRPLYCEYIPKIPVAVYVYGDDPPYTVTFEDGSTITATKPASSWIASGSRVVETTLPSKTISLKHVKGAQCEQDYFHQSTVSYRPIPRISPADPAPHVCTETGVATIDMSKMHPDATIQWAVKGGLIVSGQGTPRLEFKITDVDADAVVEASAQYPDGYCEFLRDYVTFYKDAPAKVTAFYANPATIKAGGTTELHVVSSGNPFFGIKTSPKERDGDLDYAYDPRGGVLYTFHDTHGPGTVKFLLNYGNDCTPQQYIETTLTIVP